jgi:hypothetical protein
LKGEAFFQLVKKRFLDLPGKRGYPIVMKYGLIMLVMLFFSSFSLAHVEAADPLVPKSLGGIRLGEQVDKYSKYYVPGMSTTLRVDQFLDVVILKPNPIPGYRTGYIIYGNCKEPGRIVRIAMKYSDDSRKFYNELLKRFKDRFGEPDEWRGDPFHNKISWKWSLSNASSRVSLVLTHSKDEDDKYGNSIKMAERNFYDEEEACWEKVNPMNRKRKRLIPEKQHSKNEFQLLIPE